MSKTNNLDVAKQLSTITGRPLEDFYIPTDNGIGGSGESSQQALASSTGETDDKSEYEDECDQQAEEEQVESSEEEFSDETEDNVQETGSDIEQTKYNLSDDEAAELLAKYSGELVNGKILRGRQMTRKEFLAERKKFKTLDDFWNSPLMYLMFRSEGQTDASFINFINNIEKEINK